ncbi:MAG TPA: hypothetical protein VN969_05290 [Streptosporangiaceae bacterium]|jgi:hypothetical protein|nr:hypothetical protein [Streptosporangiaceae bacterium]
MLVEALAEDWGGGLAEFGKTVWFTLLCTWRTKVPDLAGERP